MKDLPASAAIDTTDCRWPGCPWEARYPDGMCDDHRGRPLPSGERFDEGDGRIIPGALAHLMDDGPDQLEDQVAEGRVHPGYLETPTVKETPVPHLVLCRVDGCTRASVAQTGPWKGWCAEHKHEEMVRRSAKRRANERAAGAVKHPPESGQPARTPAAPKSPGSTPAAASSAPTNGTPNPASRLAEILPLIHQKREELLDLQAEAVGLVDDINELIA